jgi:2,3-bisphosphoglycerate-independent phosphoglycerate mutase
MSDSNTTPRPVMLCILDGWGLSDQIEGNAVKQGHTPNFDRIWNQCPTTRLSASGTDVGLQPDVMGNSEVGHLNIGAGRIVWQDSLLIDQTINDGTFFENETLLAAINHAKQNNTRLHLMGLVSNGSVHSSETHYFALLKLAAQQGLKPDQVLFHVFTDGRDTAPQSGAGFVARLLKVMVETGVGAVASIVGRYYAMDRDQRWGRVREAYELLTEGTGHVAPDVLTAIKEAYERGETDEFIKATAIQDPNGQIRPRIQDNDSVLFFNYRSDRGRELSQLFLDDHYDAGIEETTEHDADEDARTRMKFKRNVRPQVKFATMTRYSKELDCPIAFEPRPQPDGIGETVAKAGKTQLRMAETEKYPHVTYFFSGGNETPWQGEERFLAPSPKVATYDLQPEMSAPELTQHAVEAIRSQKYDFIVLNFANPDMVGHTGSLEAAIKAVDSVDRGLGQILAAIDEVGGAMLVIADHGNCEQMIDPKTGGPHTAHTTNLVPCILVSKGLENTKLRDGGRLADVAPTLLGLLQVAQPDAMTGIDLAKAGEEQVVASRVGQGISGVEALQALVSDAKKFFAAASAAEGENSREEAEQVSMMLGLPNLADQVQSAVDNAPRNTALSPTEVRGAVAQFEIELKEQLENLKSQMQAAQ